MDAFCFVGPGQAPRIFQLDVGRFTGRVREQHAHRHLCAQRVVGRR